MVEILEPEMDERGNRACVVSFYNFLNRNGAAMAKSVRPHFTYRMLDDWQSVIRWFILKRFKFSTRYKIAKVIGWPTVTVEDWPMTVEEFERGVKRPHNPTDKELPRKLID